MNLVEQRLKWRKEYEEGLVPFDSVLKDYRENRLSEHWRASSLVERLCEYIIFLEERRV